MYVVLAYDVQFNRTNLFKSFCRQYLTWVQNSVFEGELKPTQFTILKDTLEDMVIDEENVRIWTVEDKKFLQLTAIGDSASEKSNFI
ncbi:MAG: CRISPR-associated endonuclease Cas2 [Candidatus Methanoperedens sp.]|nr:CRISPR-associated endonuclease Cas2 [Candidatus Methanoperedens sp.]